MLPMGAMHVVLGSLSMERGLAQQQGMNVQPAQRGRLQQVSLEGKPRPALTAQSYPARQASSAKLHPHAPAAQQASILDHQGLVCAVAAQVASTLMMLRQSHVRSAQVASTRVQQSKHHAIHAHQAGTEKAVHPARSALLAVQASLPLTPAQTRLSLARSALQASTRMQQPRPHALPVLMGPSCQRLHLKEQNASPVCLHLLGLAAPVAKVRATSTAQGRST